VTVGSRSHFSKQLIKEIVKSVERGASRRELIKRYGMAKSTLADWVREYGSPAYHAFQKPLLSKNEHRLYQKRTASYILSS
jgi:transposase-like protein